MHATIGRNKGGGVKGVAVRIGEEGGNRNTEVRV
jgi:hypothetical protein